MLSGNAPQPSPFKIMLMGFRFPSPYVDWRLSLFTSLTALRILGSSFCHWDRLGYGAAVAAELGPDASAGTERPILVLARTRRHPSSSSRVRFAGISGKAVEGHETSVVQLEPHAPVWRRVPDAAHWRARRSARLKPQRVGDVDERALTPENCITPRQNEVFPNASCGMLAFFNTSSPAYNRQHRFQAPPTHNRTKNEE